MKWLPQSISILGVLVALPSLAEPPGSDQPGTGAVNGQASSDPSAQSATGDGWNIVGGGDFNYDGMSDVLWNNRRTNQIAVWLMAGTQLLSPGPAISGPAGDGWKAVTSGDFNANGMADVLWFNSDTQEVAVWLMAGQRPFQTGAPNAGPEGDGWRTKNAGDFNLDRMADVLWHNPATNQMAIWLMNGADVLARGPVLPAPSGTGWRAVSAADRNLDGMADALWINSETNRASAWLMRGTGLLSAGAEIQGPSGGAASRVESADFNGDRLADAFWNSTETNRATVWLMGGTDVILAEPELLGPLGDGWVVASAGDRNGDGLADVVWQNLTTGHMAVWPGSGHGRFIPGAPIPGPGS